MRQGLGGGTLPFGFLAAGLLAVLAVPSGRAAEMFADPPSSRPEITIQEVLDEAEAFSPQIKAMLAQEKEAKNNVAVSESFLMPELTGVLDRAEGMLGQNAELGPMGMRRFVVEPFYEGTAYGLMGHWRILDLPRYYAIKVAKRQLDYRRALTALARYHVDVDVANAYFQAAGYKGLAAAWKEVGAYMYDVMVKEVRPLMRSGYQNPVDELLVKDEVTEAGIEKAMNEARYRDALKELASFMGKNSPNFSIPVPLSFSSGAVAFFAPGVSPYIKVTQSNLEVSKNFVKETRSQNYPIIHATGGLGGATNLPQADEGRNVVGGFGVELPIFLGFRIVEQTEAAENQVIQRKAETDNAQLEIDVGTAKIDQVIDAAVKAVGRLAGEFSDDQRALKLARYRYTNFQGPLVDVRESLRDLARVRAEQNIEVSQLYFGKCAKALLNGGTLPAKASHT